MKKRYDAVVVGGGVIGCSIAFQLSKRDYHVLVIEKERIAQKASRAAAGMLGAQNEITEDSPLFSMARRSREMFPELAEELKLLSGIDIELLQSGILRVAQSDEEMENLKKIASFQEMKGETAELLNTAQVQAREPEISGTVAGGLYMPRDGQVSAPLFSQALAKSAAVLGAEFLEYTEVIDFVKENGSVSGVRTGTDIFFADEVIVAGGPWSSQIIEKTGLTLNAHPVKGECLSVHHHGRIVTSSIFSSDGYIVPKSGGSLIIGATQKPDTFDESVELTSVYQLINNAMKIIPALKSATWEKAWAGIRPQTGDGLPYLGRDPDLGGLSIATGHYRNGILLAPVTGFLMADLIQGKAIDDTFRMDRIPHEEVNA
ncbi:glycine oxidase ThiO [Virgibacillus ainsalahensis]